MSVKLQLLFVLVQKLVGMTKEGNKEYACRTDYVIEAVTKD